MPRVKTLTKLGVTRVEATVGPKDVKDDGELDDL